MVVYARQEIIGGKAVFAASCERCGKDIGNLSGDEVLALSTGRYGKVLCFECESVSCARCQCALEDRDKDFYAGVPTDEMLCWFCLQEAQQEANIECDECVLEQWSRWPLSLV